MRKGAYTESRHAIKLRQLGFNEVVGDKRRRGQPFQTPYFVRGGGTVHVTLAYDESGSTWIVSQLVDLAPYGFVEKHEDVGPLLSKLNKLIEERRESFSRKSRKRNERRRRGHQLNKKRQHL